MRSKVDALFPAHEVEKFTEHFWGLIRFWGKTEQDRISPPAAAADATDATAEPAK